MLPGTQHDLLVCQFGWNESIRQGSAISTPKNVTLRTFHTLPESVHEHIFLALSGTGGPWRHVAEPGENMRSVATSIYLSVWPDVCSMGILTRVKLVGLSVRLGCVS